MKRNIRQISGDYYEELDIVMLPTNDESSIIGKYADTDDLVFRNPGKDIPRGESQHLYLVRNNSVQEGYWFIYNGKLYNEFRSTSTPKSTIQIRLNEDNSFAEVLIFDCKQIIATTNRNLGMSDDVGGWIDENKLSESTISKFIKSKNNNEIINTNVLIEFNGDFDRITYPTDLKGNVYVMFTNKLIMSCDVATEEDKTVTTMLVGNGGTGTIIAQQITPEIKTITKEKFLLDFMEHLSTYYGIDEIIDCTKHKDIVEQYTKNN